jgi:hypothetical protein
MDKHICDESCREPGHGGGFPDCPVFRIDYTLWQLKSGLELLERDINDFLDRREE